MQVRILLARYISNNTVFYVKTSLSHNFVFFFYSFTFVSYIPPHFVINVKFFNEHLLPSKHKLTLKQSYLLLTWFYYISFLNIKKKNLNFFVLPVVRKIFTLTKAPMAHKNWSKEQYKIQTYLFKTSFKNTLKSNPFFDNNHMLFLLLLSKKNFITFETNLFFLKNYYTLFTFCNNVFFNFNFFK